MLLCFSLTLTFETCLQNKSPYSNKCYYCLKSFCEEKFICLNAFHRNVALECNKDSTNVAEMRERNLVVHFNCKSELDGSAHLKTETNITKVL